MSEVASPVIYALTVIVMLWVYYLFWALFNLVAGPPPTWRPGKSVLLAWPRYWLRHWL